LAGLIFVVAPVPSGNGEPTARLDARHTLAVFPYLNGIAGRWGEPVDPGERERVLELLAELHGASAVAQALPRRSSDIAGRPDLETALCELGQAQEAGPYSEPVRKELQSSKERVRRWLREFDETALGLASAAAPPVVTHGEPHPGNFIKGPEGFSLIDWDTVAMDRPERDLWMLDDGTGSVVDAYEGLTGRRVEAEALVLYRRAWALADLAAYISQLRRPHDDNEDSAKAWNAIISILRSEEPRPYGGPAPEP
jgi:spectinomycin phosphotransferase